MKFFPVGFQVLMAAYIIRAITHRTSETSVNFYQTIRRYNLEDSHLQVLPFNTGTIFFLFVEISTPVMCVEIYPQVTYLSPIKNL
jgi:hypothetical protein